MGVGAGVGGVYASTVRMWDLFLYMRVRNSRWLRLSPILLLVVYLHAYLRTYVQFRVQRQLFGQSPGNSVMDVVESRECRLCCFYWSLRLGLVVVVFTVGASSCMRAGLCRRVCVCV